MQNSFSTALLDAKAPVPDGVIDPKGRPARKRFNVYRNNVVVSLTEALAAGFPVIRTLVGAEFFAAMAKVYVAHNPPRSPLMQMYGENFPRFLKKFKPVAHLPYLPDTARLEWARREAYHAADKAAGGAEKLSKLGEQDLGRARFELHPSLRVVSSEYPILAIWQKNSGAPEASLPAGGQSVMIVRPEMQLHMHELPKGADVFIANLRTLPFGLAASNALQTTPEFDLPRAIGGLLQANAICDIHIPAP
ncbi:MAG TPA: DNA-binding domain-containing protein [Paracoccaceae bacterium]|nr:DNA-binding domain-containing protein [Paracoccaceae bacterium]